MLGSIQKNMVQLLRMLNMDKIFRLKLRYCNIFIDSFSDDNYSTKPFLLPNILLPCFEKVLEGQMMPQYIAQNANAYIVFYVCLGLCKSFYLRMCQIVHKFWKDLHFPLSFLRDGYWLVHFAMMPLLSLYYNS